MKIGVNKEESIEIQPATNLF